MRRAVEVARHIGFNPRRYAEQTYRGRGEPFPRINILYIHRVNGISVCREAAMGRGVSLVDSTPFVRRVACSNPKLDAAYTVPWESLPLAVACGGASAC